MDAKLYLQVLGLQGSWHWILGIYNLGEFILRHLVAAKQTKHYHPELYQISYWPATKYHIKSKLWSFKWWARMSCKDNGLLLLIHLCSSCLQSYHFTRQTASWIFLQLPPKSSDSHKSYWIKKKTALVHVLWHKTERKRLIRGLTLML